MSMNPGTSQIVDLDSNKMAEKAITQSQTLNPPTRVEYGRTMSGGLQGDATAGTELPA
jgi:hypothetical protein